MAEYFHGLTDKGKRREKNEDTFFAREIINKKIIAACVIDGVGGYRGGDVAAAIARSVIMKHLETLPVNIIEGLREAIIAANLKINEEKSSLHKNERMACVLTCVVADLKNNKCWYAHVGDTRIYLLRDRSLIKISRDHSDVGFLEESGRLSEEEAMHHPRRNEINKALGFEDDISTPEDFIETGESPFLSGDILLLCSDGLTDMIGSATITSILTSKKNIAAKTRSLIDAANDAGGNDNITAVLVENNSKPKQKLVPVPIERKTGGATATVVENESSGLQEIVPQKKTRRDRAAFLILVFIGLLVVFLTVAFQGDNKPAAATVRASPAREKFNEQLVQLMLHVEDSTKIYALKGRIDVPIKDAVIISKDSFRLKGNGSKLIADTLYKGAAFIVNAAAKNIILDSIVLENFDVGIIMQKNNVTLKNVRFINCRVPVQYQLSLPDSIISGRFKDSIFITQSKPR